ncbi:hypothetical protein GCM10010393_14670 [Streptomyces gobitricini]|uniref:Uncharacterized protein n=1 Tax=Streptomyces gobitricini TaxID=68211 RepID=A0ABP5YPK8_9ACTN
MHSIVARRLAEAHGDPSGPRSVGAGRGTSGGLGAAAPVERFAHQGRDPAGCGDGVLARPAVAGPTGTGAAAPGARPLTGRSPPLPVTAPAGGQGPGIGARGDGVGDGADALDGEGDGVTGLQRRRVPLAAESRGLRGFRFDGRASVESVIQMRGMGPLRVRRGDGSAERWAAGRLGGAAENALGAGPYLLFGFGDLPLAVYAAAVRRAVDERAGETEAEVAFVPPARAVQVRGS